MNISYSHRGKVKYLVSYHQWHCCILGKKKCVLDGCCVTLCLKWRAKLEAWHWLLMLY